MSRLYGTKVDEKRWEIIETDRDIYYSYKLIDKDKENTYFLNHIIGVEQVLEDEFLVYRRASSNDFEIARYKFENSKVDLLFSKKFSQFHFISDDRILFTYWGNSGSYRCSGVYSIQENKLLEEAKWLNGAAVELYGEGDNLNKMKLCVEERIISHVLQDPKLLFTVDLNTLQPNSDCYSQLRDSYIKVGSREDIETIKKEEQRYVQIIKEYIYQSEREQLKKAKSKLLVRKTNINIKK